MSLIHNANAVIEMRRACNPKNSQTALHSQDEMVKAVQKSTEPPKDEALADAPDVALAEEGGEEEVQTDDGVDVD